MKTLAVCGFILLLAGCFTSTKLSYGDLKFSRMDMGWQSVQVPNAEFAATNGTQITIVGYSKDSKETVAGVQAMIKTLADLTNVLAPLILSNEQLIHQYKQAVAIDGKGNK